MALTGDGCGVGSTISKAFAAPGAQVMVVARTRPSGGEAVAAFRAAGGGAMTIGEIARKQSCEARIAVTVAVFGEIDPFVHFTVHIPNLGIDAADGAVRWRVNSIVTAAF